MDIYNFLVGLFQKVATGFSQGLLTAIVEMLKIKILFTAIGMVVIITFAVKKLQEGDLFSWKNLTQVMLMLVYLGFFNWAIANPTIYTESFGFLISYPAETLANYILQSTAGIVETSPDIQSSVGYLIQKTFDAAAQITMNAMPSFSWGSFSGSILSLLVAIVYFICTVIFIIVVMLVILVSYLQIMIWKALSLFMIALMFVPQTRKMVGSYCIYIVGLTFYKPLVLVMCFFNFSITNYILTNTPSRDELLKKESIIMNMGEVQAELSILAYLGVGIIGCFICVYLVKQVPTFINQVIGAGGSVGAGIAAAGAKAMGRATGGAAGMAAGAAAGVAKNAYQNSGGGIGGLASAAAGLLTNGLSNKLGGNKLGQKINDRINQSKAGSAANDLVAKGITAGANSAKELGAKLSGKK